LTRELTEESKVNEQATGLIWGHGAIPGMHNTDRSRSGHASAGVLHRTAGAGKNAEGSPSGHW